jgi:DNA adenine methylase
VPKPFLKWLGGKRWLIPIVQEIINDEKFCKYHEPFLGGGAMFFGLEPKNAFLSDVNSDLINVYNQVASNYKDIIRQLKKIDVNRDNYLRMRSMIPKNELQGAVRFLYLNRTAFGGIYRVNQKGEFNVPYGGGERTPSILWNENLLQDASLVLKGASLRCIDFEVAIAEAGEGSLVYCDPTYTVLHNNNGFVRYNEKNFSWKDQERLAIACRDASRRGAFVIVSNAHHNEIVKLYPTAYGREVDRMSLVCPKGSHRKLTKESVFVLKPEQLSL